MKKLVFERQKYGKESLIDACIVAEFQLEDHTLIQSFYTLVFAGV